MKRSKMQQIANSADLKLFRALGEVQQMRELVRVGSVEASTLNWLVIDIKDCRDKVRQFMHPDDQKATS